MNVDERDEWRWEDKVIDMKNRLAKIEEEIITLRSKSLRNKIDSLEKRLVRLEMLVSEDSDSFGSATRNFQGIPCVARNSSDSSRE